MIHASNAKSAVSNLGSEEMTGDFVSTRGCPLQTQNEKYRGDSYERLSRIFQIKRSSRWLNW